MARLKDTRGDLGDNIERQAEESQGVPFGSVDSPMHL